MYIHIFFLMLTNAISCLNGVYYITINDIIYIQIYIHIFGNHFHLNIFTYVHVNFSYHTKYK